ncbi:histone deacetylase domain-containing protein [Irpex rosettiformis]|uniref:Histone deacetylase domain-containing protein n=1 Tax=Irpex rosettiformis TaxID=378272 RepID=A0ACB8TMG5_9APHY|nr:histone deacetylase domain-containing protein [Irpex rosettiformis]
MARYTSAMSSQPSQPITQTGATSAKPITFLHPSRSLKAKSLGGDRGTNPYQTRTDTHSTSSAISATMGTTSPVSPKRWRPWESVQELPTLLKKPSTKPNPYFPGTTRVSSTSTKKVPSSQRTDPRVTSPLEPHRNLPVSDGDRGASTSYGTINVVTHQVSTSEYTSSNRSAERVSNKRKVDDWDSYHEAVRAEASLAAAPAPPTVDHKAHSSLPSASSSRKHRIPEVKGKNRTIDSEQEQEKQAGTATASGTISLTLTIVDRNASTLDKARQSTSLFSQGKPSASGAISIPRVYLQDACLLHKYIRSRDKSNVYERPERLRAINVGIAAAYAQLEFAAMLRAEDDFTGGDGGDPKSKIHTNSNSKAVQPFDVVRSASTINICAHRPAKLIHGDPNDCTDCYARHLRSWCAKSKDEIARNGSEIPDFHEQDLYLCPESMMAFEGALGTVCAAVDGVMNARPATLEPVSASSDTTTRLDTRAFVVVRPPGHHCSQETPMGFGFVNNVAVGAMHAYCVHNVQRIIIFDYDLHHGNGTQAIIRDLTKHADRPSIFYGSIHDLNSYPCEDGDPDMVRDAMVVSLGDNDEWIHNIPLKQYTSEAQFWQHYNETYSELFVSAQKFLDATGGSGSDMDDVLIFISSGFDASEYETEEMSRHGHHVPTSFYHRFTRDACKFAERHSRGRIISVLEGGYSDKALISGALAHVTGLADVDGLTDQEWWNLKALDELEKATKKRRGRPARVDTMDGWLRRTMEIFGALEAPSEVDKTVTMTFSPLSEEVKESMSEAVKKTLLKRSALNAGSGSGPQTRTRAAKRAKANGEGSGVGRHREHLEGPDDDGDRTVNQPLSSSYLDEEGYVRMQY